jgi:hypothetical protein
VLDAGKLDGSGIAAPPELTGTPVIAVGSPAAFNPPIVTAVFNAVTFG